MHTFPMKTLRQHLLVLGALSGAAGLFAQVPVPNPNDHDDLNFKPAPITRTFMDKDTGGAVTVTWMWKGSGGVGSTRYEEYTCDIHQDSPALNGWGYSLYNLEIQGRRWEVQIMEVPSTVTLTSGTAAQITMTTNSNGTKSALIPAARNGAWPSPASRPDAPVAARIGFIKFTGTDCSLTLRSMRLRHGPPMPFKSGFGILSSHDNTPPDGWGGSEN